MGRPGGNTGGSDRLGVKPWLYQGLGWAIPSPLLGESLNYLRGGINFLNWVLEGISNQV